MGYGANITRPPLLSFRSIGNPFLASFSTISKHTNINTVRKRITIKHLITPTLPYPQGSYPRLHLRLGRYTHALICTFVTTKSAQKRGGNDCQIGVSSSRKQTRKKRERFKKVYVMSPR